MHLPSQPDPSSAPVNPGRFKVVGPHSHGLSKILPPGSVYRINTGAPLPSGADTVIMVEDTRVMGTYIDEAGQREEAEIEVLAEVPIGDNVREPGSDTRSGELVLDKGTVISSGGGEVGALVFIGRRKVRNMHHF